MLIPALFMSCEKHDNYYSDEMGNISTCTICVTYTVDDAVYHRTVTEDGLHELFHQLTVLAKNGRRISVYNRNVYSSQTSKEVVHYETDKEGDIQKWAYEMVLKGYYVTYIFDEETGMYYGTAKK